MPAVRAGIWRGRPQGPCQGEGFWGSDRSGLSGRVRRDRLPSRAHPVRVGARGAWFATVLTVFIVDFDDGDRVPRPWDQWDQRNFATDSGAHEEVIVKQEDLAEVNHVAARE